MKEYLLLLGIRSDYNIEQLNKAYKIKAKESHPDTENGSDEKFKLLGVAYEYLKKNINSKNNVSKFRFDVKEVTVEFHWNLFEVFNGLSEVRYFKFGSKDVTATIYEAPRDITYHEKPKLVRTSDKNYIVNVVNTIYTTSNSGFKLEAKGLDLYLTVLVKSDSERIASPLNGIIIDNTFPFTVTIVNKGLYKRTENGVINGDLFIDNTINAKPSNIEPVEFTKLGTVDFVKILIYLSIFNFIIQYFK